MTLATTRAAWLVMGETELGPQRRCRDCGEWWPAVAEFWRRGRSRGRHYNRQPCRGCMRPGVRAYSARRYNLRRRVGLPR